MSKTFALFVVDNPIHQHLLLKNSDLLVNHPNRDIILGELAWCRFGETSFGGLAPQAILTIAGLFHEPRKLDDTLIQRILVTLNTPNTNGAGYLAELVADVEGVRWFLEDNKDKQVSYFWL